LPVAFLPQIVVVRLEDLLAVRTTQGMATVRDGGVVKSEGINTPVHMMQQINSLNLLILGMLWLKTPPPNW
jgi:hypothetical protein